MSFNHDAESGEPFLRRFSDPDLQDALSAAASVGDDRIQESATGQVDPEGWTHGSSARRQAWFSQGFETGGPPVLRHVRRNRSGQPMTLQDGTPTSSASPQQPFVADRLAVVVPVLNEPGIARTLEALRGQHDSADLRIYVVDNGSTDDTVQRVECFAAARPGLDVRLLVEPQKGTGAASDTGFRAAIADGFALVARTDGDSEPEPDWTSRIRTLFAHHPGVQLVGGTSIPLRDEYFRWGDDLLMPGALATLRIMMSVQHLDRAYLRFVAGHNMAVRSSAYLATGGIGRTSIDERDEDIDFSVRIARRLGLDAVRIDPRLRVATSMRRVRRYGLGLMGVHHLLPALRGRLVRTIDIR